jgi:ABC-2 type transport system ATP-binding protein
MTGPAVAFENVSRRFGKTVALARVAFEVTPGSILGLIGRNGAGKTTALRLAVGTLWADEGRIRVLGLDPVTRRLDVAARVALLSEESSLYPWMTIAEIIRFTATLHPRWDQDLAARLSVDLDLDPARRIRELSRGTRAKVALVLAVATRPELLLLDDPTAGLDPLVRREVLDGVLDAVSQDGGAVVYASHLVHDVERVADRVIVLDGGSVRLEGELDELKSRFRRARAVFDGDAPRGATVAGEIETVADGRVMTVTADARGDELEAALMKLGAREVVIESLPLEEILVALLSAGQSKGTAHV